MEHGHTHHLLTSLAAFPQQCGVEWLPQGLKYLLSPFTEKVYQTFLYYIFSYLSLAVLGLRGYTGFSQVAVSGSCSLVVVQGLLILVASLVAEPGCRTRGLQ